MRGIAPRDTIEAFLASAGAATGISFGITAGVLIIDALLSAVSRATSSLCQTEQNRTVRDVRLVSRNKGECSLNQSIKLLS